MNHPSSLRFAERRGRSRRLAVLRHLRPFGAACAAALLAASAVRAQEAALDSSSVSAAGRSRALLSVERFGRYSVLVESKQGVALQLTDRMAGPGEIRGTAGEEDGRVDEFLDRGAYRIATYGPEKGTGRASLSVRPFVEKNPSPPPLLVELKPLSGELHDLEQLSFTLEISERRRVILEAAGRDLADLRLWQGGQWLVDAAPQREVITPEPGRPLNLCRLSADLQPGSYILAAYGGPAQKWGEENGRHPFHLRSGIPRLGEAGRMRCVAGPFGFDRWLVPEKSNFARLELPEALPATLSAGWFDPATPFSNEGTAVDISKNTSPPVAEIEDAHPRPEREEGEKERLRILTVRTQAGQAYILQQFRRARFYEFRGTGDYWISTVRTGDPRDAIDPTVILVAAEQRGRAGAPRHATPLAAQVAEIDPSTPWARRCNLLGKMTLLMRVRQAGSYKILAEGPSARFVLEPFMLEQPRDYQPPVPQGPGSTWDLEAGFYVLTILPDAQGVLDLAVCPAGLGQLLKNLITGPPNPGVSSASVRFPRVTLEAGRFYLAFSNEVPETKLGYVVRPLPLDLSEPLPVAQAPGDTVRIPFELKEPSTLRAEGEDGALVPVSIDGAAAAEAPKAAPGLHTALLTAPANGPVIQYSLYARPERLAPDAPPPAPTTAPDSLPAFPLLTSGAAQFLDLDREASATYLVRADRPGLYRVMSTGLLATSGNLRSRTVTCLDRGEQNGTGRNFLLQQYLREGDYQITLTAQGQSCGHLGLALTQTPTVEAGELKPGRAARLTLPAGSAAAYTFEIPASGTYRLESGGLRGPFRCRLEDAEGWPCETPGAPADVKRAFDPGRYRLVLLPGAVDARAVTLLEEVREPVRLEGHGPHPLPLATKLGLFWTEPAAGEERLPDVWSITLPAACDAAITLTSEMQGSLKTSTGAEAAFIPPGRAWEGPLEAGSYRLESVCSRKNQHAPYEVEILPKQMCDGMTRELDVPATLDLAVGRDGLLDLESSGACDVRGALYDASGKLVASNDDRADDWNFQIAVPVSPGVYRLKVDPVGTMGGRATVTMRMPREVVEPTLTLPAVRTASPGDSVLVFPLDLTSGEGDLLVVAARSGEAVACALEAAAEGRPEAWSTLTVDTGREVRLVLPLPALSALSARNRTLRLRLWSCDRRGGGVEFTAARSTAPRFAESKLKGGIRLARVPGITPAVAVARLETDRPGLVQFLAPQGALRTSGAPGEACRLTGETTVSLPGTTLWLAADSEMSVRGARRNLEPGADRAVRFALPAHGPARVDLGGASAKPATLVAVLATALEGQPGLRVAAASDTGIVHGDPGLLLPDGAGMAAGPGAALTVALVPSHPSVLVWPADETGLPSVRLQAFAFAKPETRTAAPGRTEGVLPPGAACTLALPSGVKWIRLSLEGGLTAALIENDQVQSVHWTGGRAFDETTCSDGRTLAVLNLGTAPGRFEVGVVPTGSSFHFIVGIASPSRPYEERTDAAGILRLVVGPAPLGAATVLHVRTQAADPLGAAGTDPPVLIGQDGSIRRGWDLPVGAGRGTLLLPHPPGLVVAYLDRPGDEEGGLWGWAGEARPHLLAPPQRVELKEIVETFQWTTATPQLLSLRAACPSLVRTRIGQDPAEVKLHAPSTAVDLYLPGGMAEIALRGLAGADLEGAAEVTSTPVASAGEGLGEETLLSPGTALAYSFVIGHKGLVGIGVRASSDVLEATLLDARGRRLGQGLVQMPDLEPGTYLLVVRAPSSGGPVTIRPALAGIVPPDTGPPPEVIRSYIEKETGRALSGAASPDQPTDTQNENNDGD